MCSSQREWALRTLSGGTSLFGSTRPAGLGEGGKRAVLRVQAEEKIIQ